MSAPVAHLTSDRSLREDPLLTVDDVARVLRVTPNAARKTMNKHRDVLRPALVGRRYYVRESDLARLLDTLRVSA